MKRSEEKQIKDEKPLIKKYIEDNYLSNVKYSASSRKLMDIRDYLIVYLSVRHKLTHAELCKMFNLKARASITTIKNNFNNLITNKEYLDNIKETNELFNIKLEKLSPKRKSSNQYYSISFSLSKHDIIKLERFAEDNNYEVRDVIHNFIKSLN